MKENNLSVVIKQTKHYPMLELINKSKPLLDEQNNVLIEVKSTGKKKKFK
jgi:hypothetical protein